MRQDERGKSRYASRKSIWDVRVRTIVSIVVICVDVVAICCVAVAICGVNVVSRCRVVVTGYRIVGVTRRCGKGIVSAERTSCVKWCSGGKIIVVAGVVGSIGKDVF